MTFWVTYLSRMDDDAVSKALADPTRRALSDLRFAPDGRSLTDLESQLEMTRFGVMKHLRVLEDAVSCSRARPGGEDRIECRWSRMDAGPQRPKDPARDRELTTRSMIRVKSLVRLVLSPT